jgi:hypothetical protein
MNEGLVKRDLHIVGFKLSFIAWIFRVTLHAIMIKIDDS